MVDGDANIDDEEMVDGDANIDDEEMVDANIDDDEDEEMVDANIDDEGMVDGNIDDEEMVNFEVWDGEVLGLQSLLICRNSVCTDLEIRVSSDRCFDRRVCANLQVFRIEATGEGSSVNVPSSIQSYAWPFQLDSRNLIDIAKTGSDLDEFEGFVGNYENDWEDLGSTWSGVSLKTQELYTMMLLARYLDLCGDHRAISHGIGLKVQPKQDDLLQVTSSLPLSIIFSSYA
ncbi:hypothetical protein Sjap_022101 [Stephania japonica]|uniref:Uncharacterized protein n=1 Tax=Stephania japonica TaxID=461633 RepID=A0AAP0ENN5_9MAGN